MEHTNTLMWQQFLAILFKNRIYWKRNWILLPPMHVIITVILVIFFTNLDTSEAKLAYNNTSMKNLLDPQVLFVAGTSEGSPEMKRLTDLFRQNVQRCNGKFIELKNGSINESKIKVKFFGPL
jgi:energy-coupling factor transporter transmembrane protein EcfT